MPFTGYNTAASVDYDQESSMSKSFVLIDEATSARSNVFYTSAQDLDVFTHASEQIQTAAVKRHDERKNISSVSELEILERAGASQAVHSSQACEIKLSNYDDDEPKSAMSSVYLHKPGIQPTVWESKYKDARPVLFSEHVGVRYKETLRADLATVSVLTIFFSHLFYLCLYKSCLLSAPAFHSMTFIHSCLQLHPTSK